MPRPRRPEAWPGQNGPRQNRPRQNRPRTRPRRRVVFWQYGVGETPWSLGTTKKAKRPNKRKQSGVYKKPETPDAEPTLAPPLLPSSEVPCRYFETGFCARGDGCWFKHDVEGYRIRSMRLNFVPEGGGPRPSPAVTLARQHMVPGGGRAALCKWRSEHLAATAAEAQALDKRQREAEAARRAPKVKARVMKDLERILRKQDKVGEPVRQLERASKGRKVIMLQDDKEPEIGIPGRSEAEDCGICGDTPKTYGLQSGCDHIYCYDCLKSWRAVAADSRTCPTCRTKSEFIFPSSVYPYTPGKKTAPAITKPDTAEDNTDGTSSQDELSPVTDAQSNELSSNKSVSGRDKSQPEGTETTNGETKDTTTPASTENAGETSAATPQTKKRTRQKKKRACKNSSKIINDDPNPAKTRLLNNYLQKLKTIPCKFFCNPALSLKVQAWDEEQSICWTGSKRDGNSDRRIPFCKFGNHCRFSHPHPEKPLEEYIYDDWEIDMLRIKPQNVRGRNIDMWQNRPINDWGNVEVDPEFVQDLRLMGLAEDLLLDWGVVQ